MNVNGVRIRADFVARDGHGNLHVFEAKHGTGRLTPGQKSAGVFDMKKPSNDVAGIGGGIIHTSQGTRGSFEVRTGNSSKNEPLGGNNAIQSAIFHVLHY